MGCTLRLPDYPVRPASSYPNRFSQELVEVAIHPITNKAESNKYFGTDLVSRNVLAALIVVDNHSSSSLVLDPAHCQLVGLPDRADDEQLPGKTGAETVMVLSTVAISLVGGIIGTKMIADSENIKANIHARELRRQTLSPGESAQGFLYFRIPDKREKRPVQTRWLVTIPIRKIGTDAKFNAEVRFEWER
jgi:hypothetical protein